MKSVRSDRNYCIYIKPRTPQLNGYLVGAWVAFRGIEALVSGLGLPEWVPGFALVVMIMGFPE